MAIEIKLIRQGKHDPPLYLRLLPHLSKYLPKNFSRNDNGNIVYQPRLFRGNKSWGMSHKLTRPCISICPAHQ